MAKKPGPEKVIENSILSFLDVMRVFTFKVDRQGTFDPVRKVFRSNHNPYKIKGVSDILGCYHGRFLAIEVKSKTGTLSQDQRNFLARVENAGGIAFMAKSLPDCLAKLYRHLNKEDQEFCRPFMEDKL